MLVLMRDGQVTLVTPQCARETLESALMAARMLPTSYFAISVSGDSAGPAMTAPVRLEPRAVARAVPCALGHHSRPTRQPMCGAHRRPL